jgi:hypothetical protein
VAANRQPAQTVGAQPIKDATKNPGEVIVVDNNIGGPWFPVARGYPRIHDAANDVRHSPFPYSLISKIVNGGFAAK